MIRVVPVSVLLVAMLGLGCASEGASASEPVEPATAENPARTLTELERRLQDADRVEIAFETESEGAVASQFRGTLVWVRDGEMRLDASGEFAGQPQQIELRADTGSLELRVNGQPRLAGPRPAELVEAVALGFVRQGVLHNLAMATMGRSPEKADGGMDEWLRTVEHRFGDAQTLEFEMEVEGQRAGHVMLRSSDEGLPIERRVTVEFPEGQMRVVERYTKFVVE